MSKMNTCFVIFVPKTASNLPRVLSLYKRNNEKVVAEGTYQEQDALS